MPRLLGGKKLHVTIQRCAQMLYMLLRRPKPARDENKHYTRRELHDVHGLRVREHFP